MSGTIELLYRSDVRDFLRSTPVGHLATADADGAPHNIPLCFWCEGRTFYFIIDAKPKRRQGLALKRMRNIVENPRVSLVVDHYEEDWRNLAYVLVHGHARLVDDRREYELAMAGLREKYVQYRIMPLGFASNPIVRIEPERVHLWGARFAPAASGAAPAKNANAEIKRTL